MIPIIIFISLVKVVIEVDVGSGFVLPVLIPIKAVGNVPVNIVTGVYNDWYIFLDVLFNTLIPKFLANSIASTVSLYCAPIAIAFALAFL